MANRTINAPPSYIQNKRLEYYYFLRRNGLISQQQFFEYDPKYENSDTSPQLKSQSTKSETVLDHIINRLRQKNWPQNYTTIVVPSSVNRNLYKVHVYNEKCNSYLGTTSISKGQLMKLQQDNVISHNCVIFASKDIELPKDNMMNILLPTLIQAGHCKKWKTDTDESSEITSDKEISMNTERTSKWNPNASTESTTPKDESSTSVISVINKNVEAPISATQEVTVTETDLSSEETIDGPNIEIPLHRPLPIIVPKGLLNCHETKQQKHEEQKHQIKSILKASSSESSTSRSDSSNKRKISFILKPTRAHKSIERKRSGFLRMNDKLGTVKDSRRMQTIFFPLRMLPDKEFAINFDNESNITSSNASTTSTQTDPYSLYSDTTDCDMNALIFNETTNEYDSVAEAEASDDESEESKESTYSGLVPELDLHDSSISSNESIVSEIECTEAYKNMHIDGLLDRINNSIVPSELDLNLFFDVAEHFKFKIFIRPELICRSPHDHEDKNEFCRYNIECFMLLDFYVGRIILDHDKLHLQLRSHPSILSRIHVINDVYEIVSEVPQSWTQFLRHTFDRFGMQMLYDVIGEFLFDVYKQCSLVKKNCWTEK